ncbi:hypothetical protein BH23CHL8_BH23CHL8_30820 [soil metagenome]
MNFTAHVDTKARAERRVVSTRYPKDRIKLLEAVQARRGDRNLSDTISGALDECIESHLPGALVGAEPTRPNR